MSSTETLTPEEIYERNPKKVEELAERDDAMGVACRAIIDLAGGENGDS